MESKPTHPPGDVAIANCPQHGPQPVTAEHAYTGYAGGSCWMMELACGCTDADESADVRAAQ